MWRFGVYHVLEKNSSFIRNITLCNIFQVFTDTFDQFNATLLNKSINFFKNIFRVIIWLYGPQNLPKHWAIEQCYGQKQKVFFIIFTYYFLKLRHTQSLPCSWTLGMSVAVEADWLSQELSAFWFAFQASGPKELWRFENSIKLNTVCLIIVFYKCILIYLL